MAKTKFGMKEIILLFLGILNMKLQAFKSKIVVRIWCDLQDYKAQLQNTGGPFLSKRNLKTKT